MKRHTLIALFFACCTTLFAQVHIHVSTPDAWTAQELAPYIGQTVEFDCPMVVCSNASSTLTVAPWRIFEPLSKGVTGSLENRTAMHVNNTCAMSLSGVSGYHRCGEKIVHLRVKVNSTTSITWVSGEWTGNTRKELQDSLPDLGDYDLLVCGFNLENYFVAHLGKSYLGPDSYEDHQKQRAKVSKALRQINADIFGLVELEQGNDAIQEIVNDLNNSLPERNYKFFSDGSTGSSQKSDFVYDANIVEPVGLPLVINTELQDRKKMLCFREIATGEKFIYSINHFKSMNTGDEYRRVNEARAVVNSYNSYRANSSVKDKDVLFMGDMNCYAFTDPIHVFTNNGMIDLHRAFHADSSYSYMFGGRASYIDHALSNSTLFPQITGMSGYHINSDENDYYTYDKSSDNTMFRCSDHDPVLVGLKLDSTLTYDPSPAVNTEEVIGGASTMTIRNGVKEGLRSFYALYSIQGTLILRDEITDSYQQVDLPMRAGVYILYIYYDGQVYQRKIIVR